MKIQKKPTKVQITGRVRKGVMSTADSSLPYSRKSLEALAAELKMHRALIWMDPATNSISLKHLQPDSQRPVRWTSPDDRR